MRISDEQIAHFRRHGYVLIEDFLTPVEVEAGLADIATFLPSPDDVRGDAESFRDVPTYASFPLSGDALNLYGTHPEIISFVERVLGTTELEIGEMLIWGKYEPLGDFDQPLHVDFWGKNSIGWPTDSGPYQQIPMILYYSDVTIDLGPTYVVSREHTRDDPLLPPERPRADYPELYRYEQPVLATPGSLLIFSMVTFHRGSAITRPGGVRYAQFMTYHGSACHWMQKQNWPTAEAPDVPQLRRFLERATPRQREMIGFPPPGHPYWSDETLQGVGSRYPGLDLTPYRNGL